MPETCIGLAVLTGTVVEKLFDALLTRAWSRRSLGYVPLSKALVRFRARQSGSLNLRASVAVQVGIFQLRGFRVGL